MPKISNARSVPGVTQSDPRWSARIAKVYAVTLAVLALVLPSGLAAFAADASGQTPALLAASSVAYDATPRVPVVESQVGVGGALSTSPAAKVTLTGVPAGHDTALVRISVFDVTDPLTVFAAGTPALAVESGSASSTVLVPVSGGTIGLYGTAEAPVRVELLASFVGDPATPGSTIALAQPVKRADTAQGLGDDALNPSAAFVGVVGLGGVPATGVRSVYVSATVTVPSATNLTIGNQTVPIKAGTTVVTTVVSPDEDGNVPVRVASGEGELRLDVRGWVPEAAQDTSIVNVPGSFVPAVSAGFQTVDVASGSPSAVATGAPKDGALALMLVSASTVGAAGVSTIDLGATGEVENARSQGAVVDPVAGAQPQLILAPASGAQATGTGGSARLTATPVGAILATQAPASGSPVVSIDSPAPGAVIDLSDYATFTLEGSVQTPGSSLRSVSVKSGSSVIGTASVQYTGLAQKWSFETSVPASGPYTFTVEAVDRSGAKTSKSVSVNVRLPEAGDVVVAENAALLPESEDGTEAVSAVTEDSVDLVVEPDFAPGDVIVADASSAAPEGFLRKVEAIDRTEDGWRVTTSPAVLTDVIQQADVQEAIDLVGEGDPTVTEYTDPQAGDNQDVTIVDEGEPAVQVLPIEDLDVAPYPDEATEASAGAVGDVPGAAAQVGVEASISKGMSFRSDLAWKKSGELTDDSKASAVKKAATKAAVRADAGVSLSTEVGVSVTLEMTLKVSMHFDWGVAEASIDEFRVVAKLTEKVSAGAQATVGVGAEASWKWSTKKTLAKIEFEPITFMVGPVPVVITTTMQSGVEASVEAKLSADGRLTVSADSSIQRETSKGFTYSTAGGMKEVNTNKTTHKAPEFSRNVDLSVKGSFEAKAGLFSALDISLYDAAGPEFTISAGPGFKLEVKTGSDGSTANGSVEAALYAHAKGEAAVHLKLPVIDKTILEWKFPPIETKVDIWRKTLSYDTALPLKKIPGEGGSGDPDDPGDIPAGESQWYLTDNDTVLHIGPGTLPSTSFSYGHSQAPWSQHNETVQKVVFDEPDQTAFGESTAGMFYDMPELTNIEGIGRVDTGRVRDMSYMFFSAPSLVNVDAAKWNMAAVESIEGIFAGAASLKSVDVSKWDTQNVSSMAHAFSGATSLVAVDVSKWDTHRVSNMEDIFSGASSLVSVDVSGWNTGNVKYLGGAFSGASSLGGVDVSRWNTQNAESMDRMFAEMPSLVSVDVSGWNTGNVKYMNEMFWGASSLRSVDVSRWNTGNVLNMEHMFSGASSLVSVDVSGWNTGNVKYMNGMFAGASTLRTVDVSRWNTGNVENIEMMFSDASSLESVDVSRWNTSNVQTAGGLLSGATSLISVDVSRWNTGKVWGVQGMFSEATSLTSVDVSQWDTRSLIYTDGLFYNATSLRSVDVSRWNTEKVLTMQDMFSGASSLTSLDVSHWNTSNVFSMEGMLSGASSLRQLTLGADSHLRNPGLPSVPDSASYTGAWQAVGAGTPSNPSGSWAGTSEELIARSQAPEAAGTYVWQPRR